MYANEFSIRNGKMAIDRLISAYPISSAAIAVLIKLVSRPPYSDVTLRLNKPS